MQVSSVSSLQAKVTLPTRELSPSLSVGESPAAENSVQFSFAHSLVCTVLFINTVWLQLQFCFHCFHNLVHTNLLALFK